MYWLKHLTGVPPLDCAFYVTIIVAIFCVTVWTINSIDALFDILEHLVEALSSRSKAAIDKRIHPAAVEDEE